MSYILSRKFACKDDSDFVVALARCIYCDWFLSDPVRESRVLSPGVDLTECIPETQRWAFQRARGYLLSLESESGMPLAKLLDEWQADAKEADPVHVDRDASLENLGWYCGMQAVGHGVGLRNCGVDTAKYFKYGNLPFLTSDHC